MDPGRGAVPELLPGWVERKRAALADPEFGELYLPCDEAWDWDPDDPRLEKLAARVVAWTGSARARLSGKAAPGRAAARRHPAGRADRQLLAGLAAPRLARPRPARGAGTPAAVAGVVK